MRQSVLVRVNPNRDERRRKATMEMERITGTAYGLVMRQGVANAKPVGAGKVRGMKEPGAAMERAHRQLETGNPEGGHGYPPIGRQGGAQPMGNSGKGRAVSAPAKFTGLHVVVDNSRCMPLRDPTRSAQRGSGIHLVLI